MAFLVGNDIVQALYDAGTIIEDPKSVRRIVVDLEVGQPGRIYIEKFADDEKLRVALARLEVVSEEEAGKTGSEAIVRVRRVK